jgi:alkylhydroperoxidase family enzyme
VLGREVTQQVLEDFERAPIAEKLRATLRFLKKMTLEPEALGAEDVVALRAAGVSTAAARDAAWVAAGFNVMTRLADTLGWEVPDERGFAIGAKMLLTRGYL